MVKKFLVPLLLCLVFAGPALAADQYVLDGGTSSTCSSWSDACDQITTAETRAARGDTIWVGDGTYGTVTFNTATTDQADVGRVYIYAGTAGQDMIIDTIRGNVSDDVDY